MSDDIAAAASAVTADATASASNSAVVADSTVPAAPEFVTTAGRSEAVPLDWPLVYDGRVWDTITVSRMTAGQIAAFLEKAETAKRFPMFDAPDAVLDALDADDADKVNEVVNRFLPRRFRDVVGAQT